jgi:hypothetical protein
VLKGLKQPPPAFVYAHLTFFLIRKSEVGEVICCRVSSRDEESGYFRQRDLLLAEKSGKETVYSVV